MVKFISANVPISLLVPTLSAFLLGVATAKAASKFVGTSSDVLPSKQQQQLQKAKANEHDEEGPTPLSSRGELALRPFLPYFSLFFKCLGDPYHATDNPDGHIALCVAENRLTLPLLKDRLVVTGDSGNSITKKGKDPAFVTMRDSFNNSGVYCYGPHEGLLRAREAVAYFIAKNFLLCDTTVTKDEALKHISPDNVLISAGAGSILHYLFYALGEPGDGCLVPSPYYAAFENDMGSIAGCQPIGVPMQHPERGPTVEELEAGYQKATKEGQTVRFLLLTNPNNPFGVICDEELMQQLIDWAKSKKLHIVVDEIYGMSVRENASTKFTSILKILNNDLGNDVHFVWAMSKDFGASGFRIGTLLTHNTKLMKALGNLNAFSLVSHPMQLIMASMLLDDDFTSSFLGKSRDMLQQSYDVCTQALDRLNIPYIPADAGIFVYADFSSLLPDTNTDGFDAEAALTQMLFQYCRLLMTPGAAQRDHRPGHYRICYAWQPIDVLRVGMQRIEKFSSAMQRIKDANGGPLSAAQWKQADMAEFSDILNLSGSNK